MNTKFNALPIRHGDVGLKLIDPASVNLTNIEARKRDNGRVVLAYGEVTGHAHAITEEGVSIFEIEGKEYLKVENVANLKHEEHATITVEAGLYEIVHQREYTPEAIRNVAD